METRPATLTRSVINSACHFAAPGVRRRHHYCETLGDL
jgi:hypothetical protein